MGKREDYTKCMVPYMKGGGPDRKERFCLGAKLCSGKAANEDEARKLCADAAAEAAANPKPKKSRGGKCKIDVAGLATCIIGSLHGTEVDQPNLTAIISGCVGQKAQKVQKVEPVLTRKEFIKKCYKQNPLSAGGSLGSRAGVKEMRELQIMCKAKWEEQENSLA